MYCGTTRESVISGESSTSYTLADRARHQNVPELMAARSPDIRLIHIVRNPFARIQSAHGHNVHRHGVQGFRTLVDDGAPMLDGMLKTSLHDHRLHPYFERFGPSRIHVTGFAHFVRDQTAAVNGAFDFLDLDPITLSRDSHENAAQGDRPHKGGIIPRPWLTRIHDHVVQDANAFGRATGVDVLQWGMSCESCVSLD